MRGCGALIALFCALIGVLLVIQKFAGADKAQDIMVTGSFVVGIPLFLLVAGIVWLFRR